MLSLRLIDIFTKYFDERLKEARSRFEEFMKRAGASFEWRVVRGIDPEIAPTVSEVARSADLLILSDVSPENSWGIERDFVANVVMDIGSPVLILPHQQRSKFKIEQVVCGYNGSKQSARHP